MCHYSRESLIINPPLVPLYRHFINTPLGAIYHYASFVYIFWYVSYVITVLLILSFPFRIRTMDSSHWKPHLVLFLVSTGVPLAILIVYWSVDAVRYEVVNHPLVCLPEPTMIVAMFVVPLTITLGLSLTSVALIISQLIINQLRLRNHKTSDFNNKQTQFIIRTLAVIIFFTAICLYLIIEFGVRTSFSKPFQGYVELYWSCITRYGTNTSCCQDDYTQFYHPELTVLNDFFFSIWGIVALSTLAVKEARKFWTNIFRKCLCERHGKVEEPEPTSSSHIVPQRRMTEVIFISSGEVRRFENGNVNNNNNNNNNTS